MKNLESLRNPSDIASLEILKSPKFWTVQRIYAKLLEEFAR